MADTTANDIDLRFDEIIKHGFDGPPPPPIDNDDDGWGGGDNGGGDGWWGMILDIAYTVIVMLLTIFIGFMLFHVILTGINNAATTETPAQTGTSQSSN